MHRTLRFFTIFCLSFFATQTLANDEFSIFEHVVEHNEIIAGKPMHTHANDWWEWAYSMQQASSPIHDELGEFCAVNQSGPIWYLAGGFGSAQLHRRCTVPAGKHIFFPIINAVTFTPPGEERSCEAAIHYASIASVGFTSMSAFVNGREIKYVERFRLGSKECFNLFARVPAKYEAPSVAPSATSGYWIMLRPLPAGKNTIQFMGYDGSGSHAGLLQSILYELEVLPE